MIQNEPEGMEFLFSCGGPDSLVPLRGHQHLKKKDAVSDVFFSCGGWTRLSPEWGNQHQYYRENYNPFSECEKTLRSSVQENHQKYRLEPKTEFQPINLKKVSENHAC